jgi:mannose-1-phosphate guanylyltransferase
MKKKGNGIFNGGMFAILLSAFVLSACASQAPIIWDDTLPESDSASVYWYWGLDPTAYNGIPIEQKKALGSSYSTWQMRSVKIPAGDTEMVVNVYWNGGYVRWIGNDFIFSYNFEAGKQYVVAFQVSNDFAETHKDEINEWGVGIYEQAPPKSISSLGMNKKSLIAFIPFDNQPTDVKTRTYRY